MKTEELLRQLETKDIAVFGTGFVAEMFYMALDRRGLASRLQFAVVTTAKDDLQFHGKPVFSLNEVEFSEDMLLCVVVHESAMPELKTILGKVSIPSVWIYPNLFDLLYGLPVRTTDSLPVRELLSRQDGDEYWLAVRYAAIRDYLRNESAYPETCELYRKALSLHCGYETAVHRNEQLEVLAASMAREGFRRDCPVRIDEAGRIIDGLHRIACAAYLQIESVPAVVYPASLVFDKVLGERNRLPEHFLRAANFSDEAMAFLRKAQDELMKNRSRSPEISVILPVYNVGEYLDVCMESLEEQTFRDFEILLINDGSTDDSPERCRSWAAKDGRIRFIDKSNEGVAPSRNLGVRLARGKYLAFVDPDDWLDPTYLEKLYTRLEETGADFAECDLWRYDNRTGKKIYRSCGARAGKPYTLREHMKYGPTATYKSMSRRSLWEKYDIRMPDCSFESPAIYALVLALSGRVESIPEALYYYRRFRENSLIENGYAAKDGSPNNTLGIEAMEYLLEEFRRCGIYEAYSDTLEGVEKYRLNDILAMQFHRKSKEDFRELVQNNRHYLEKAFPDRHNEPYITWGGYNLNRVLTHMNWLHDPSRRFNFSSIISICEKQGDPLPPVSHKNRYRRIMLEREREFTFWQVLEEVQPRYLFIDLIEERFDLVRAGERYLTKSDAYDSRDGGETEGPILKRLSPECTELWKNSATEFVNRIWETVPQIRPVIVETLLSEMVGDIEHREPFPNLEEIRRINELLAEYYSFLESLWPEATVFRLSEDPLFFTDRKYEYGAIPSHLNEVLNQKLAEEIEQLLEEPATITQNT